jgi:hypothetical protein
MTGYLAEQRYDLLNGGQALWQTIWLAGWQTLWLAGRWAGGPKAGDVEAGALVD